MVEFNGEKYITYYEVMDRIGKSYLWVRHLIITRNVKTYTIAGQGNYRFIKEADVEKLMRPLATENGVPPTSMRIMLYNRGRAQRLKEKAEGEKRAARKRPQQDTGKQDNSPE